MTTLSAGWILFSLAMFTRAAEVAAPATAPAAPYRMTASTVYGNAVRQWVLVIVAPSGYPSVTTPEALKDLLRVAVPQGSTLRWEPSDVIIGGEPLRTQPELDDLRAACAANHIQLVIELAG